MLSVIPASSTIARAFMLPESQFPVTGGIMQTEEVVPCAQSTSLDELATTDHFHQLHEQQSPQPRSSPLVFQSSSPRLHLLAYDSSLSMAVKQEPQEQEDERSRQSATLGSQTADGQSEQQHKCQSAAIASGQSSPDSEMPPVVQQQQQQQQRQQQPTTTAVAAYQQNGCKKPPSGVRRKSRWKLKFHHQALPPEYLDHYEAALAQEAALNSTTVPSASCPPCPIVEQRATSPRSSSASLAVPASLDVQSWLQRLAAMQSEFYSNSAQPQVQQQSSSSSRRSVITSTQHLQQQPRPPMKYSDLPYMGEITLDNSKPRRGRKPKKADICHLIYKNYGTILPGTPGIDDRTNKLPQERLDVACKEPATSSPSMVSAFQRTDIQNRISSLLEKRLTQESRRALESSSCTSLEQEEPMNLCIRDLNLLKIRLQPATGNATGNYSRSDASSDAEDAAVEYLAAAAAAAAAASELAENNSNGARTCDDNDSTKANNSQAIYWEANNASTFVHPVALPSQFMYYQQKLAAHDKEMSSKEQRIVPKSIYSMLESHKPTTSEVVNSVPTTGVADANAAASSPRPKRNSSSSSSTTSLASQLQQPTKRKRSAIFIPPMPTENNNNPATEVSICKFKFTGGAKPSLQEKKSLSVDSGGNFRYYSGTGDKSMRGYEFFPRETLQQPANQPSANNNSGAFLNAAAERIPSAAMTTTTPQCSPVRTVSVCSNDDSRNKKRKTRKSMQREKLEQTFKEKGFLIQTQQLESAEGATYCKFRQLRKFTRYLFRSWKDYLPGELTESDAAAAAAAANELQQQHSNYVEPSIN